MNIKDAFAAALKDQTERTPTSRPEAAFIRWFRNGFLSEQGYYAPEGQRPPLSCAPATRRLKARDRRQAWQTTSR